MAKHRWRSVHFSTPPLVTLLQEFSREYIPGNVFPHDSARCRPTMKNGICCGLWILTDKDYNFELNLESAKPCVYLYSLRGGDLVSKYRGRASADPEAVQRDVYLREKVYRLQDLVVNWKPRLWKDLMIWRVDKSTGFLGDLLRPSGALQNDLFPIDTLAGNPSTQMENEESASDIDLSRCFQPDIDFGYTDRMPIYIYVSAVGSQRLNDIVVTTETSTLSEIATQPSVLTGLTMPEQDSTPVRTPTAFSILSRSDRESIKINRTSRRSSSIFSRRGNFFKPAWSNVPGKIGSLRSRTSNNSLIEPDHTGLGDSGSVSSGGSSKLSRGPSDSSVASSLHSAGTNTTTATDQSRRSREHEGCIDAADKRATFNLGTWGKKRWPTGRISKSRRS